ncbi:MAG TPA: hypothetical protein VNF29_16225 [Candidatus Binataceae bacterium]|nr:hypothetical protein [Candidatus Binataceae bacterium]
MKTTRELNLAYSRVRTCMGRLAIVSSFAAVLLTGCSTNAPTPATAALNNTELSFNLAQCAPVGAHIYKCPAVDKPICDSDYVDANYLQCVHLGKKGSVFVTGTGPGN